MSHKVEGKVVAIAQDGSLVTDITGDQLKGAPTDERVLIHCDEHETRGLFSPDHAEPDLTLIAILLPGETLRIEIVGDSAAVMLGVTVGQPLFVQW